MSELVMRASTMSELQARIAVIENRAFVGMQDGPVEIVLRKAKNNRSNDQNRRLWAVLRDVSEQVEWYGRYLPSEAWKDIFSSAIERQDVVPGIEGGFVMIGGRTSKMSKQRFADLLTLIDAFGSERNIRWSDPALKAFAEYREATA